MDTKDLFFGIIISFLVGVFMTLLLLMITDHIIVDKSTLDAVCKDKIPNTEFKKIDKDNNIVCQPLPQMQRLDHPNNFIYVDNGDE